MFVISKTNWTNPAIIIVIPDSFASFVFCESRSATPPVMKPPIITAMAM